MNAQAVWIAVPTYWTFPAAEAGQELTVFDHPTPLGEDGTLVRTLESFRGLKGRFNVLVVAAGTNPAIGRRVHEKVSALVRPFAGAFPVYLVSPANLPALNGLLPEPILKLDSYGNIRNVQLALPFAGGADLVVGIDDDEVIEDAGYLGQVQAAVGSTHAGATVAGIAGPYFDAQGEYRIAGAEELAACDNIFIKKNYFMNEALKKVMEPRGARKIVRSNVAFGGNMAMARATIAAVCHDPYIPRGEDYDYVINAAMAGLFFCFLPGAGIVHLPPDSTGSQAADKASKLLADIRRFIYMRAKMRRHAEQFPGERFDPGYLQPYPGCYLDEAIDLRAHGVEAIRRKVTDGMVASPEAFVDEAVNTAAVKAREFFDYRGMWRKAMRALEDRPVPVAVIESFRVR
jgi:hypothetical protein